MTLEEEWEATLTKFHRMAALIVRKKNGESCGEDHEWRPKARFAEWTPGGYVDTKVLSCLVCEKEANLSE